MRGEVSPQILAERLLVPWKLGQVAQDVGLVQRDAFDVDPPATWRRYAEFHDTWKERIEEEKEAIRRYDPHAVLADIPYLPIQAAKEVGLPAFGVGSLSWDRVLNAYEHHQSQRTSEIIAHIRECYQAATVMLQVQPAMEMDAFEHVILIPPIVNRGKNRRESLRSHLGIAHDRPLVLLCFGGFECHQIPYEKLTRMTDYLFVGPRLPVQGDNLIDSADAGLAFPDLLASVDVLISKPGYNLMMEAVAAQCRIVYVPRHHFPDEASITAWVDHFGAAMEMPFTDFLAGKWQPYLQAVLERPWPKEAPLMNGAEVAGKYLRDLITASAEKMVI